MRKAKWEELPLRFPEPWLSMEYVDVLFGLIVALAACSQLKVEKS